MKINIDSNNYNLEEKSEKNYSIFINSNYHMFILAGCGTPTSSPIEDFSYEFKDGEVTITGYIGTDREIVIPDTIEDRPVTVIGEKAFQGYDMTSIIIPNTITIIQKRAFDDCKRLEK